MPILAVRRTIAFSQRGSGIAYLRYRQACRRALTTTHTPTPSITHSFNQLQINPLFLSLPNSLNLTLYPPPHSSKLENGPLVPIRRGNPSPASPHQPTHRAFPLKQDSYRLPEGTTRVGYDADTQTYTYKDSSDGSLWEGPAGSRYGKLTRGMCGSSLLLPLSSFDPGLLRGLW